MDGLSAGLADLPGGGCAILGIGTGHFPECRHDASCPLETAWQMKTAALVLLLPGRKQAKKDLAVIVQSKFYLIPQVSAEHLGK